jgi:hypothetical protein
VDWIGFDKSYRNLFVKRKKPNIEGSVEIALYAPL